MSAKDAVAITGSARIKITPAVSLRKKSVATAAAVRAGSTTRAATLRDASAKAVRSGWPTTAFRVTRWRALTAVIAQGANAR